MSTMRNICTWGVLLMMGCSDGSTQQQTDVAPSNNETTTFVRHQITGDFNGDGQTDTLTEHVFSAIDSSVIIPETNSLPYDSMVARTYRREPVCQLKASIPEMTDPTLLRWSGQLFGLAVLENKGDLDHNGTDEVGVVVNWADYSNLNTYHLYTCTDTGWKELFSFGITEMDMEQDRDGLHADTTFHGYLTIDNEGRMVAHTYALGEHVDTVIDLNKK